jgi:hypothetical protein
MSRVRATGATSGAPITRNATARWAAEILVQKNLGYVIPTAKQKKNLAVAFVNRGMIVYGRAFDIIRLSSPVNLNEVGEIERHLDRVTLYEIKSTAKGVRSNFDGHFFSVSGAEVLVSQSLKSQFKFVFVNVNTGKHLELTLPQMFGRAKGMYSAWSISF